MNFISSPKVFMIAETSLLHERVIDCLEAVGVSNEDEYVDNLQDSCASAGEGLVELCGRLCYKSFEVGLNKNVTKVREGNKNYIGNILKSGHGSVLEHSTVSFAFIGVSRVFTHEIVRHRAGTAFSQESLRYVRLDELEAYFPDVFANQGPLDSKEAEQELEAKSIMRWAFESCEELYAKLGEVFGIDDMKDFSRKKKLTSAMRRVAPIGLATNIVVTANHRAWRHIIEARTSEHAEEELQNAIGAVANMLKDSFPAIYQDMEWCSTNQEWTFENSKV